MKRRWIRRDRVYRFTNANAQSIIFGAGDNLGLWAWGVWGWKSRAEGIEHNLVRAKQRAEEHIDELLAQDSKEGR